MIPAEAVEAAAKMLWLGGTKEPHRLRRLREALEAAAPYMQAQAWDQGYDRAESDHDGTGFWTKRLRGNPYMLNNEGEK